VRRIWAALRGLRHDGGQATVELALLVTILAMPLVFGMVEMGFLFSSHLTIVNATREGARSGGNSANGGGPLGCPIDATHSPNAATVDPEIIASIERVLVAGGSLINLANVTEIDIFKATATGGVSGTSINVWTYTPNAGPVVDGNALEFSPQSVGWQACSRTNVIPADALGVTVKYTYTSRTPVRFFLPGFGFNLTDSMVMRLNATQ
jgi:TadE-like protein